jgi:hypothetical protein
MKKFKCLRNVDVNTQNPLSYLSRREGVGEIDAYKGCVRILTGHLPERILDNRPGVIFIAHQLTVEMKMHTIMPPVQPCASFND